MEPALVTRGLRKVYRKRLPPAVDTLDLTVARGQVFGLLGPNGAGKTTAIGMLLGSVFPTAGSGTLLGKPLGDREARRRVGYLPEKFQFHDFLTAAELLDLHGRLYGMGSAERRRRIRETLALVDLAGHADSRIGTFSRGMQQRIGLAQAVLHDPELVILDEPTSALDPLGRRAVRDLILHLKGRGATVLLNSHLLSEVERTCDAIAILRVGRVVRQGSVAEITGAATSASVVLELEQVTDPLVQAAGRIGEVTEGGGAGTLTVALPSPASTPDLVAAVVAAGGRVRAVTPVHESLEDAFIRLVEEAE